MVTFKRNGEVRRRRSRYTGERWSQMLQSVREDQAADLQIPPPTAYQAEFETELLLSLGSGFTSRCPRPPAMPFGFHAARPTSTDLTLHVLRRPEVTQLLVERLVVVVGSDESVHGLPGLRVTAKRDRIVLRDAVAGGRITLRGISGAEWRKAVNTHFDQFGDFVGFVPGPHDPITDEELVERRLYSAKRPAHRTAAQILAGILRRFRMFRAPSSLRFLDIWVDWPSDRVLINVEWAGDLTHASLLDLMTDPIDGLPVRLGRYGSNCLCDTCLFGRYSIQLIDTTGTVHIYLRRSHLYEETDPPFSCNAPQAELTLRRSVRWTRPE